MSDVASRLSEIANRDEAKVVSVRTDDLRALLNSHARLIEALDELLTMIGKARVDLATIDKAETALSQAGGRTP